jgi:energy-coupling factor transporter ATP-binding protein EcfA2
LKLKEVGKGEIAVVGSPSSTSELALDVLDRASSQRIVGGLVRFDLIQDGRNVRVTGQITSLEMRNRWHENDVMRNIIKTDGSIPFLSGKQDVRTAVLAPGAVFSRADANEMWGHDILGTVPPAGTRVIKLDQATLDELVEAQRDDLFYVGRAYGDDDVALPMYLKHFGSPKTGGQGEAYHSLVVGKTGSGKSTLAKFLLTGYARHEDMAILVVDPKGEFGDEVSGYVVGDSGLPFRGLLRGLKRAARRFGVTQIRLEGYELFEDVLSSLGLDRDLNIRGVDNKLELATAFSEIIRSGLGGMTLDNMRSAECFKMILERIADEEDGYVDRIYKSKEPQDSLRKEIKRIVENPKHRAWGTWDFIGFLFERGDGSRQTVGQIVRWIMESDSGERPLVVLDLSVSGNRRDLDDLGDRFKAAAEEDRDLFTDGLQKKIIYRIVSDMRRQSEMIVSARMRSGQGGNVNTLVVFEEAHRFAPRTVPPDDEDGRKLKTKLIEAVRETRKFGLGWLFIDQTIGGIDREITQQVRCAYFGYGLSMGDELERLRELIGGDPRDAALYRSFKDPASYGSPQSKKFPWMAFGPVSPMAANHPLFFNAFGGAEFSTSNNLPVDNREIPLRLPHASLAGKRRKGAKSGSSFETVSVNELPDDLLG